MAIYLDSAFSEDARRAQDLGFVHGITTNPRLIAQTGRSGFEVIHELVTIFDGLIFYQVTETSVAARFEEAQQAHQICPEKVIIKVPATTENLVMTSQLTSHGIACAMTAVYTPAQAYLGAQANATFVIPYVNRMSRFMGNALETVRSMVQIVAPTPTQVFAASFKSVDEIVATLLAGVAHVTVPLDLILAMGEHELSQQAIAEFNAAKKEEIP
jgi:transaldolase